MKNQCDGCRVGMPLDEETGTIHQYEGKPFMVCTKSRYKPYDYIRYGSIFKLQFEECDVKAFSCDDDTIKDITEVANAAYFMGYNQGKL